MHLHLKDFSSWISWCLGKAKDEEKEQRWWELYLHTGALTGQPYAAWKERMENGG